MQPGFAEILTPEAIAFLAELEAGFGTRRRELLAARSERQKRLDAGEMPDFLGETRAVRDESWKGPSIPAALRDRRVEITGPVDRKMVINALNSGAQVYMADFEDSHSPTWKGTIEGQINLRDAIRGTIRYESPEGKRYALGEKVATLFVRPRGWHLTEKHALLDGKPLSGSLFDFGLFFYHNARELIARGAVPCFYLPKLEGHLEARLWNDIFVFAQERLGIPRGTVRATVLIETILAAFEMDEILFELREHSAGLNCGRWDYIFSFIKKFRKHPDRVLPDRALVTMETHFLKSYVDLLIHTCHRRGVHAMGGMAAQIPIKTDPAANAAAIEKVRKDKLREVRAGHDGTWVAHPGLVSVAREIFDAEMKGPNQIDRPSASGAAITADDLLAVPQGPVTEAGIRTNVGIALLYMESWLQGSGCVPLHHLMEDAATAEISRAQLWQWIRAGKLARARFEEVLASELESAKAARAAVSGRSGEGALTQAADLLRRIILDEEFAEFLTLPAYEILET